MPSIVRKITKFTKIEIDYLFAQARRVFRDPSCVMLLAPRQKDFGRVLIIASRKVGNAPERNTLRRRIKAIFYEEKLFERPFDFVIILHKKAVALSFEQLKNFILNAYKKEMIAHESSNN